MFNTLKLGGGGGRKTLTSNLPGATAVTLLILLLTAAIVAFLLAPPNTGASNRPSEPLLSPPPLSGSIPQAEKTPIVFGELNWLSVAIQTRIAQYIVEMGYGYPTQAAFGESVPPLIQALGTGEVDVLMEVWVPPNQEDFNSLVNNGEAVSLGESLSKDWQSAFVIPAYLQQQYPQLDHVNDLKTPQFQALFATPASGGKALLVSCVPGWACESANSAQITAYGLSAHVTSTNPISQTALFDSVSNAYEQGDPWLGYMWRTADPALLLNLVRLEEPPHTSQCWATTKACAYPDSTVLIGANANLPTRAPRCSRNAAPLELRHRHRVPPHIPMAKRQPRRRSRGNRFMVAQKQPRPLAPMGYG